MTPAAEARADYHYPARFAQSCKLYPEDLAELLLALTQNLAVGLTANGLEQRTDAPGQDQ